MLATNPRTLENNRNQIVAKSFYKELRREGFSHEQIIDLSTTLLDFVTRDISNNNESIRASK
ncbi:MAG: hypothetical protein ACJAZO_004483 [Myxococcota bacterium]|jgi:hypothetical protein